MAVPSLTVQQIPAWIEQQAKQQQQRISADALALMSTWVQGNLFAAQQALLKLSYLYPVGDDATMIDESAIREVMSNSARYDVVDLEIAILQQNCTAALTITDVLQHEGVALPLVLWQCADLFETLLAIKANNNQIDVTLQRRCRLWFDRQTRFQHGVQRYHIDTITQALQQLHYLERQVKGVPAQSLSVTRNTHYLSSADGWQGLKAGLMTWLSFEQ
jgi:DNA polymerase-3 subunit delta